jgi:hypothetical protein
MAHWKKTSRLSIMDVEYEAMIDDQQGVSRDIIEFCGLEWDPQCLNFHRNRRAVSTHSVNQVRRPIYTRSVARWRNYEAHIAPLLDALECVLGRK